MMTRGLWILICGLLLSMVAEAQTGEWKNYTSMKDVRSIARTSTAYWAATSGGLFSWTEGGNTYRTFTNAEGLQTMDLTAVAIDGNGNIWSGAANGMIHVLSPASGAITAIPYIAASNQTAKQINSFTVLGDSILICSDFGLSIFRIGKFEFGDTYSHFGSISTTLRLSVHSATVFNGRIWATITDGQAVNAVASAPTDSPNLLFPASWTLQQIGSASTNIPGTFAVFHNTLYLTSSNGLYAFDGSAWIQVPGLNGHSLTGIATAGTTLFVTSSGAWAAFGIDTTNTVTQYGPVLPFLPAALTISSRGTPSVATQGGGIATLDSQWVSHFPNGPNSNQFSSIAVDPQGIVWGASGPLNGTGMYRFDGKSWTYFSRQNSALASNEIYRISIGCNGSTWAASWGGGSAEIPALSTHIDSAHVFNSNVGMVGVSNNPFFVVTSNTVCDGQGNQWMAIKDAADKKVLAVRTSGGTWRHLPLIYNGIRLFTLFDAFVDQTLAVDASDNLWSAVRDASNKGVVCLQNGGAIDSTAAFIVTADNGLPSNEIKTLVIDKGNNIWVGTDKGIAIIVNPANPTIPGSIASYKPLPGLVINTIAIDPIDRKWVGTNKGVVLLSSDGTQELASYSMATTSGKLIDDDIKSIAIDPRTGTVYFASSFGLASISTPAAAPNADFDQLKIYPNPYLLPNARPLTVDGLVENSNLKILTSDGRLVRELKTPGGRIGFWDGTDESGKSVASGIYVIVAYAEGGKVLNGKVAVISH